jgi:hypothetical protein
MSDPYRWLELLPTEQAKKTEKPKRRIPWLLIAHAILAIACGYGSAYVASHGIAPWADFLNVTIAILMAMGLAPHVKFEAERKR